MFFNNLNIKPGLYVVSTPIGNLKDISKRAVEVLNNSNYILCEDTRVTFKLLKYLNIKKKLVSYYSFNEKKKISGVIKSLKNRNILSLVCDAGTPTLSDPGNILISKCYDLNINVYPIPGPSAITCAISISGFQGNFYFSGFLPKKKKEIEKYLNKLKIVKGNLVFFFPARDLEKNSRFFLNIFPNSNFLIAREMTKIYETYIRDKMENLRKYINANNKGETTFIINNILDEKKAINLDQEIRLLLGKMSSKDISEYLSNKLEIKRKSIYQRIIKLNE